VFALSCNLLMAIIFRGLSLARLFCRKLSQGFEVNNFKNSLKSRGNSIMPEHNLSHKLDGFQSFDSATVKPIKFIVCFVQINYFKNISVNFFFDHLSSKG